jgi:hypothetical protein
MLIPGQNSLDALNDGSTVIYDLTERNHPANGQGILSLHHENAVKSGALETDGYAGSHFSGAFDADNAIAQINTSPCISGTFQPYHPKSNLLTNL